jgi:hypothetical protein
LPGQTCPSCPGGDGLDRRCLELFVCYLKEWGIKTVPSVVKEGWIPMLFSGDGVVWSSGNV